MQWLWDNVRLKKEERDAMFLFICLVFGILLTKWYILRHQPPKSLILEDEFKEKIEYVRIVDQKEKAVLAAKPISDPTPKRKNFYPKEAQELNASDSQKAIELFDFDPNKISVDSLQQLGISSKVSNTIANYRKKGGRFFQSEDLKKIYGLTEEDYERLLPYIKIAKVNHFSKKETKRQVKKYKRKPPLNLGSIDINTADTTEFKKLKGIGSVYAGRIVKFRNSLGGYFSIDQIKEVWGISDSLYLSIRPYLRIDTTLLQKQNINALNKQELVRHPYIDWKKAKAILSYRKMHGDYQSMDEFEKLHRLTPEFIDTLRIYFVAR